MSGNLCTNLRNHSKWPYLKVCDWQPLAREEWSLSENLGHRDPRYNHIFCFCKNERDRRKKVQAAQALAHADAELEEV